MTVLGIFGSPRRNGNSDILLDVLLKEAEKLGASVKRIYASELKIAPCTECNSCSSTGKCVIEDDMQMVYREIESAKSVIVSTPVFFYNVPAQLKCLIDRAQAMWARKYILGMNLGRRKGFLIAVGATSGEKLFDGVRMTVKYFFDAIGAEYSGELLVRGVEGKGEVLTHPDAINPAKELAFKVVWEK
jgi:multimeric flavodoxin WrbA